MKHRDSIIDEIHTIRERIGRAHDFDADRIAESIREHEREAGRPIVKVPSRRKAAAAPGRRERTVRRDGTLDGR